jgi:lysophospholipase L1-like esterase
MANVGAASRIVGSAGSTAQSTPVGTEDPRRWWRSGGVRIVARLALIGLLVVMTTFPSGTAGAGAAPVPHYLALGGSASVGFQPVPGDPHGRPTHQGYTRDLVSQLGRRWPGLELVAVGCPGETTGTLLAGGDRCHYAQGSQLAEAVDFLRAHRDTRLITVDIGFNDIARCIERWHVHTACVSQGVAAVRRQLPTVLSALREAAGSRTEIVGVGHYDPYLALELHGEAGRRLAAASLQAIENLDGALRSIYAHFGMPMANVLGAFASTDAGPVTVDGRVEPVNVERTCQLTWMCARRPLGPNVHPNDRGYRVIARAIEDALSLH